MKRHAVIGSMVDEHLNLEIATFLNLGRSFIFNVRSELKSARFHMANVSCRKQHCHQHETIKTPKFTNQVDENRRKLMRAHAWEMQIDEATIWCVTHRTFVRGRTWWEGVQFLPERTRDSCQTKDKRLFNKLKHQEESGMLLFRSK